MAAAIAFDFFKSLVEKLFFKAVKEIHFAAEKDSHIESLAKTKAMIEAWLLDVDATVKLEDGRQLDRPQLQRLSCAMDKIDDLLDETAARSKIKEIATFKERVRLFFSINSNPVVSLCRDIRHVKHIRTELDSIVKDHALLQSILSMLPKIVSQRPTQNRDMGSDVIKEEVIGRDQDRDAIIRRLLHSHDHSSPFSVIAIVGIGGIGKTTLAQYVYNDRRVEKHFDKLLWVHASRDFDAKEILEKILASAKRDKITPGFEMHVVQGHVQQEIEGRKYLLVLDDVWDDNQKLRTEWQKLTTSLAHGGTGSKVLITTRDEGVARKVDSTQPHKLTVLGKEDSWVLFQRFAFPPEGQVEPGLKEIGHQILEKCPKTPLVIRAIGGLLRDQGPNKDKWQAFRDLQNLSTAVPDIMESLKLSYNQLDPRLKLCFAYCSLFPRGWEFDKDKLICLWIALGYVEALHQTQSLEDEGEEYVLGLMNRGFFQDAKKDEFGCITSFRMHDMMHDLALLVAGSKYKVLDSDHVETDHKLDERLCHVSFWKKMENFPSLLLKNEENLQSLLFYSPYCRPSEVQLNGLSRFRHLRAVSLRDSRSNRELPQSIGKLIHLRYLDLSFADSIPKLPSSITQLVNLFYLDLSECWSLKELPRDISKLVKLRHLNLAGCLELKHMPSGLGNLKNLQTLGRFVVGEENSINRKDVGGLDELKCLNNLKGRLELVLMSDFEYGWADDKLRSYVTGAASLQGKGKLVSLEIYLGYKQSKEKSKIVVEGLQPHSNLRQLKIRGYKGERLPSWMMSWGRLPYNSLPNLVEITLSCFENCRYLSSFGRLPHLKVLTISEMEQLEYVENTSSAAGSPHPSLSHPLATASPPNPLFPSLECLVLESMPKLKGWRKMMCTSSSSSSSSEEESQVLQNCCYYSAFPRLKELVFFVVGLEFVPEEFRDLLALESLRLDFCSQLKEVPEWIDTLTSLKKLEIHCCDKLTSLPKEMTNLSNLENLEILGCPILEKRCEKPTGEDWRLIQHVPRVRIGWNVSYS